MLAALLVAGGVIVLLSDPGDNRPRTSDEVLSAEGLVNSIGVNVHLGYADTAYADHPTILGRLRELGVRHIRDATAHANPLLTAGLRAAAGAGFRGTLIADPATDPGIQVDNSLQAMGAGVEAFEGPNELDDGTAPGWAGTLSEFMPVLAAEVSRVAPGTSLIGPSFIDSSSRTEIGDDLPGLFNGHPYAGGDPPEPALGRAIGDWAGANTSRGAVFTEAGYHNALAAPSYHTPVSEEAAAIYIPRTLVAAFGAGARRTFLYELADSKPDPSLSDPQQHFGLLRNDLTSKPAFTAVQTLIRALGTSPSAGQPPAPLPDLAVAGDEEVHRLWLEKRDGSMVLALWRPVSVWDEGARRAVDPGTVDVDLSFSGRGARGLEVWRPSVSAVPVEERAATGSLSLGLAGDLVLVNWR